MNYKVISSNRIKFLFHQYKKLKNLKLVLYLNFLISWNYKSENSQNVQI